MSTPEPAPDAMPEMIRIVVDLNPRTNEIGVIGPIENLPLFLGMLETAKAIVLEQRAQIKGKSPLVMPALPIPNLTRH